MSSMPRSSCTLRVCGRKKLPFAGYSVVKEPAVRACARLCRPHRRRCEISFALAEAAKPSVSEPKAGGEYRARTGDLLVANQALSQLS